jgi:hypothetical protein
LATRLTKEYNMKPIVVTPELTEGEKAILKRLERSPIELYWGRSGWVPESLPKAARRKDFDSLCSRRPELVQVEMAKLLLANEPSEA